MLNIDLSEFPHVEQHFNIVAFDLQCIDRAKEIYTIIVKYYNSCEEEKRITAGMFMRTNIVVNSVAEAYVTIQNIVETGVLFHDISATGYIYDEENNKIDQINWNEIKYEAVEEATLKMLNLVPGNATIH